MEIKGRVAVITGAGSGIGEAVAQELANREVKAIALVDLNDHVNEVAENILKEKGIEAIPFVGDTTDSAFRADVFDKMSENYGIPSIIVPAAGITRDRLAVKIDKETGKADIYPEDDFRLVLDVNLMAPVYWGLEMVARIAEDRASKGLKRWNPEEGVTGTAIFIGSISSQGNKGQISYSATKAGIEGAASTLTAEGMYYGIRCGVIHPGFTDTAMVRAMGDEYIENNVIPLTQLRRLIRPEEIADAICFLISNSAVTGELWADAGWHPTP
jgi:NAD(P)-dependent dehydrogenase (short-subunit alcohol dehydrogenase family)